MRLLDLTLPDPAANLALDEALLLAADSGAGGEVLRLWENPTFAVVLGAAGSLVIDVNEPACRADDVPVLRRASGGGTVLLGPGCLCFTVVLNYDSAPRLRDITVSIRYVLGRVQNALKPVAPDTAIDGTSDLTVGGRKFSGNAQQRKRRHFLHHGTLLHAFDLGTVAKYLNPPERQPDYRRDRPHTDFVTNLPADGETLRRWLAAEWMTGGDYGPPPLDRARELVAEKYGRDEWVRRR